MRRTSNLNVLRIRLLSMLRTSNLNVLRTTRCFAPFFKMITGVGGQQRAARGHGSPAVGGEENRRGLSRSSEYRDVDRRSKNRGFGG